MTVFGNMTSYFLLLVVWEDSDGITVYSVLMQVITGTRVFHERYATENINRWKIWREFNCWQIAVAEEEKNTYTGCAGARQ